MSKLWLSKNRTQHSNEIVWFSIGMQEKWKRKEDEKNDNGSASTMWWLVWHIFFICGSIDMWITRCHPTHVCNNLYFFFPFWLLLLCALLCVRVSCLFNTSLFLHKLNQKNIHYNVCVMSLCVCRFQWKTNVSRLICVFPFLLANHCLPTKVHTYKTRAHTHKTRKMWNEITKTNSPFLLPISPSALKLLTAAAATCFTSLPHTIRARLDLSHKQYALIFHTSQNN